MKKRIKQQRRAEKIARLTKAGLKQVEIAQLCRVTSPTIRKHQKSLGLLPARPSAVSEPEILRLLGEGCNGLQTARALEVPLNRVYRTGHKNGVQFGSGRPQKIHDPGDGLHAALGCIDAVFGKGPLPFNPTRDHDIAMALFEGFVQVIARLAPDFYARSTERNLEEFRSNLAEALRVKRICGATAGTVH